ncbi:hypothetical protein BIW11_01562 [Tropilaelaps mercedesae]|uniref:Uncharacterized protein n=1 Tax=Tropilaelaps mercedesae TaxID=418985 RepID=A0A1V9XC60_9ACAR|nr:hypothetical protein BIW11_01562 [Tropilaelaps mercedesae]
MVRGQRGGGGGNFRHHKGAGIREKRRKSARSGQKRRRMDQMEEKHVLDTYDAEDGKVYVVEDTSVSNTCPNSYENASSSSESEQENAFHDLLSTFNKKIVKNNKHSFRGSDEEDETELEADSDDKTGDQVKWREIV